MRKVLLLVVAVCFTVLSFAQDAAEKINQANEALQAKDYTKAFALYEDAMGNLGDVQVPDAINYNIGLAGYNSKNYEKAIAYFDKAITAKANAAKAHDYKARSYNKLKDYANAVTSYEAAIAGSEGDTKALVYNVAVAAYRGKMYEKAIEYFTKSVENGFKGEVCQLNKANAYNKLKNSDAYKATLEEGVEKFTGNKKMAQALAKIYFTEGYESYNAGKAIIEAANTKVKGGSMSTEDDSYKAEIEKGKTEFKAAILLLEKASELDPTHSNAKKVLDACQKSI